MGERVIVVGAGIGGLSSALAPGRAGHRVILLERDPLPTTGDAEEAFTADRRGAQQVHQTHGFLARLVVEMRRHFPDVLDALRGVGCVTVPAGNNLGDPQPGDEDLAVLIVRRTTLEWLLREAVLAEPGIEVRTAIGVNGILQLTDDLVGVLDDLGHERAVFVGHDWGSMVVWTLALRRPERVAGVAGMSERVFERANQCYGAFRSLVHHVGRSRGPSHTPMVHQ